MKKLLSVVILAFISILAYNFHSKQAHVKFAETLTPICDELTGEVVQEMGLDFPNKFSWVEKYKKFGASGKTIAVLYDHRDIDTERFFLCNYAWINESHESMGQLYLGMAILKNDEMDSQCLETNICYTWKGTTYRALFAGSAGENPYGNKGWEASSSK